ncbi:MAG: hypothetical protein AAF654_10485 [Myxococcota bacterium]
MKATVKGLCFALALSACGSNETVEVGGTNLGEGARLSIDYLSGYDVIGFSYEIRKSESCASAPNDAYSSFKPITFVVDLVDGIFPGQIQFIETTFDPNSRHLGADLFVSLPVGCYDVTATPLKAITNDGGLVASSECRTARISDVVVEAEQTTDADVLISQCVGQPVGALDTLVLLNAPPEISVSIDEKFNYECEVVEVCVDFFDNNDDPMRVEFTKVRGPGNTGISATGADDYGSTYAVDTTALTPIGFEDGHRLWTACADIYTRYTDDYDFQVKVYDLDASGVPFEAREYIDDSSSQLTFPIYTNWVEYNLCYDVNAEDYVPARGVDVELVSSALCSPTTAEEYYCDDDKAGIAHLVCDDNGRIMRNTLYPDCE